MTMFLLGFVVGGAVCGAWCVITLKKDEPHGEEREVEVVTDDIAKAEKLALAVEGPGWLWWGSRLDKANV